jgi:SAM-dependent methyltransferase
MRWIDGSFTSTLAPLMHALDEANGYDAVVDDYTRARSNSIGVSTVLDWATQLEPGAAILDVGCGTGDPISTALVKAGFAVHGVDASPNMVAAFRERLPGVPVVCEPFETSTFHGRTFAGVLAWGLVFLLPEATQRTFVDTVARALAPGGRLLFTAPWHEGAWTDVLTDRPSVSLGAKVYRSLISGAGLVLVAELDDEGDNHYFSAIKP